MLGLSSSSERRKAGTEKFGVELFGKLAIKSRVSILTCMALPRVVKQDWGKIMHVH